jgi:LPS-assembly lipoprotein
MWSSERRRALNMLAALPLLLAGCGFEPLYGTGSPAGEMVGRVQVAAIDGDAGFVMRERLTERLGEPVQPSHRLDVDLALRQVESGITQQSEIVTYSVIATADVRVVPVGGGAPVLEERLTQQTAYTAPVSSTSFAYASRVARQDAERRLARMLADRIVMRLAVTAGDWAG